MFATVSWTVTIDLSEYGIDKNKLNDPVYLLKLQERICKEAEEIKEQNGTEKPIITDSDIDNIIE